MPISSSKEKKKAAANRKDKMSSDRRSNEQSPTRAVMPRISQQDIVRLIHSSEQHTLENTSDVASNKKHQSELFA